MEREPLTAENIKARHFHMRLLPRDFETLRNSLEKNPQGYPKLAGEIGKFLQSMKNDSIEEKTWVYSLREQLINMGLWRHLQLEEMLESLEPKPKFGISEAFLGRWSPYPLF